MRFYLGIKNWNKHTYSVRIGPIGKGQVINIYHIKEIKFTPWIAKT